MWGNYQQSETNFLLNYKLISFLWLIYVKVNIQNVLLCSNAGMEMTAPLVNAIVNNALWHSNLHINQTPPQIIHILRFCLVDVDS